jgi:hypothetical protein
LDDPGTIPKSIKDKGEGAIQKYKEEVTMGVSIACTILMLGASLAAGFAGVTGSASKMADAVKKAGDLGAKMTVLLQARASQIAEIGSSFVQVGEAATMVVSGGYGISIAYINFDMKEADNQKTSFFAMQAALNQFLDSQRDAIATSIETLGSAYATIGSVEADVRDVKARSINRS